MFSSLLGFISLFMSTPMTVFMFVCLYICIISISVYSYHSPFPLFSLQDIYLKVNTGCFWEWNHLLFKFYFFLSIFLLMIDHGSLFYYFWAEVWFKTRLESFDYIRLPLILLSNLITHLALLSQILKILVINTGKGIS